ncbi:MAG: UDP-N-acetylmuramoyl-tripeptide--D-alanyl-D-alanine ligase [Phycisphaera sp.]|nr:UDP-N-acetylmuramoyl-tripeptide--D-alanyl-D-alanine ligase [Phycisphaera sp.]
MSEASGSSVFEVHCPSIQAIVLATRAEVLRRPSAEAVALTTDTRGLRRGSCFVALRGERFDGHAFVTDAARAGAAFAIVETHPGEAALAALPAGFGLLRVASTRRALGQIAHAWRRSLLRLRVAAVTGSAGKTTTRRLLEGIFAAVGPTHASPKSFNNDIGVPLTLLSTPDEARFLVAEIGMNHPGEILPLAEMVEPEAVIVTLAGRAHLEGLGSVEAVATEKASILAGVSASGVAVVNGDNPPLLEAVSRLAAEERAPARIVRFGLGAACDYRLVDRRAGDFGGGIVQEIEVELPRARCEDGSDSPPVARRQRFGLAMPGAHNAMNAVAALAAAIEMGVEVDAIRSGLAAVAASDMRLERLEVAGRTVFNDAYNANPDAMAAALSAFAELAPHGRRVAILGEMRELGGAAADLHAEVGRRAAAVLGAGDALVAVGPFAADLVAAARVAGFSGDALSAGEFSEAVALEAGSLIPSGSTILLKGSRGARMERFLAPLAEGFARAGA